MVAHWRLRSFASQPESKPEFAYDSSLNRKAQHILNMHAVYIITERHVEMPSNSRALGVLGAVSPSFPARHKHLDPAAGLDGGAAAVPD